MRQNKYEMEMRYISPTRLAKITCDKTIAEGLGRRRSLAPPVDGDTGPSPEGSQFGSITMQAANPFQFSHPAIPLLEIYPTDILIHVQKDSRTRLFIV